MNDTPRHVRSGTVSPMHDRDCPGCIFDAEERTARYAETNPHRKGTKAWAKRELDDRYMVYALDMRNEHYWQS